MKLTQNLHTHSTFCDGKNSLEENVISAIEQGLNTIGFSSHYPPNHDTASIKEENVEYNRLLKEYFDTPEAKNRYREGKVQSIDVNPIENSKIKILQTRPKEYELIGEDGLETTKEYLMDRFKFQIVIIKIQASVEHRL